MSALLKEERYCLAVRSFEFDKYLGPYAVNQFGEWKLLSNYITKSVIERIGNYNYAILLCFSSCVWLYEDVAVGRIWKRPTKWK